MKCMWDVARKENLYTRLIAFRSIMARIWNKDMSVFGKILEPISSIAGLICKEFKCGWNENICSKWNVDKWSWGLEPGKSVVDSLTTSTRKSCIHSSIESLIPSFVFYSAEHPNIYNNYYFIFISFGWKMLIYYYLRNYDSYHSIYNVV